MIPQSLLSPVTAKFMATLPAATNPCGLVKYGYVNRYDEDMPVAKIDWQKSDKHTIFGRFTEGNLNQASSFNGASPLTLNTFGVHDLDYQVALGDTYLIGASMVNSFRLSASRTNVVKVPDNYKNWSDFGGNYTPSPTGGETMNTTVSGGLGFLVGSSSATPGQSHNGPNPSVADDVTWVKGNSPDWFRRQHLSPANELLVRRERGREAPPLRANTRAARHGATTGLGMADLVLGQEAGFSQGTTYGFYNRQYYASLYAQDSWKVTSQADHQLRPALGTLPGRVQQVRAARQRVAFAVRGRAIRARCSRTAPVGVIVARRPALPSAATASTATTGTNSCRASAWHTIRKATAKP